MGSSLQKYKQQYKFLSQVATHPQISHLKTMLPNYSKYASQFIVLKNSNQQYRVYHQEFENIQHAMELYQWRSMTSKPIVKIYHVDVENYQEYQLASQNLRGFVFTQHLVMTLDSIRNIAIQDAAYIMKNAFIGYSSIFRVLGYVVVRENLIGITNNGECKVWINNCFSLNIPSYRQITAQDEAIYEIIKIVRNSTAPQYQCFFISLLKHLDYGERVTFKEAFQFIQNYEKKCQINKIFSFKTQELENGFSNFSCRKSQISQSSALNKQGSFLKLEKLQNGISFFKESKVKFSSNKQNGRIVTDRSMQLDRKNTSRNNLKKSTSPSFLNMKKWKNFQRRPSKKTSFHFNIVSKQGQFQSIREILSSDHNLQAHPPNPNLVNKKKINSSKGVLTSIKQNREDNETECRNTNYFPFKKNHKPNISHQFSISICNQTIGNCINSQFLKGSLTSTKKSNIESVRSESKCSKAITYRKYRCPYKSQFIDQNTFKKQEAQSKRHSCQRVLMNSPFNNLKKSYDKYQNTFPMRQTTENISTLSNYGGYVNQIEFKGQQLNNQTYRPCPSTRRFKMKQQQQFQQQKIKQKQEEVLKNNSWKKTIQCLLNDNQRENDITLNQSISLVGEEGNLIQSPKVQLQMLANLGREIKNSVCPY